MKVVYVAGPRRAGDRGGPEERLALAAAALGCSPIVPRAIYGGVANDDFWIAAMRAALERCDAVLLTDDWRISEVARDEVVRAIDLGIPVFTAPSGLESWLRGLQMVKTHGR